MQGQFIFKLCTLYQGSITGNFMLWEVYNLGAIGGPQLSHYPQIVGCVKIL